MSFWSGRTWSLKTKEPAVTANLSFAGKYAVLTSGNRRLGISSKLNKEQKAHYKELLHEFDTESYGLIIRTNAASVADETLIAEIRSLEQEWSQMRENVCHKTCYSVLKKARPTYLEDVKNQREGFCQRDYPPMTADSSKPSARIMGSIQNSLWQTVLSPFRSISFRCRQQQAQRIF